MGLLAGSMAMPSAQPSDIKLSVAWYMLDILIMPVEGYVCRVMRLECSESSEFTTQQVSLPLSNGMLWRFYTTPCRDRYYAGC
jgi:hypothetical protein